MPETFHHLELHALHGPHAEKRQTALAILIRKMNQLEAEINELKKTNPAQAEILIDELEAVIEQAEKTKENEVLIDEVEKVIESGVVRIISGKTPEGQEVKFELKEQLEYWRKFYEENGVDWVTLPDKITVTPEQVEQMQRLITELGFDKMIIIPAGLVGKPEVREFINASGTTKVHLKKAAANYEELHQKMSAGYNYAKVAGFDSSKDRRNGLRLILTKDVKELDYDSLLLQTLGKSPLDMGKLISQLSEKYNVDSLAGFMESEYLIYQREYFLRTKNHLDVDNRTWLLSGMSVLSGRIPIANFDSIEKDLRFFSDYITAHSRDTGSRLAGHFSL